MYQVWIALGVLWVVGLVIGLVAALRTSGGTSYLFKNHGFTAHILLGLLAGPLEILLGAVDIYLS